MMMKGKKLKIERRNEKKKDDELGEMKNKKLESLDEIRWRVIKKNMRSRVELERILEYEWRIFEEIEGFRSKGELKKIVRIVEELVKNGGGEGDERMNEVMKEKELMKKDMEENWKDEKIDKGKEKEEERMNEREIEYDIGSEGEENGKEEIIVEKREMKRDKKVKLKIWMGKWKEEINRKERELKI